MADGSRAARKLVLMVVALVLAVGGIVYFHSAAEESQPQGAAADDQRLDREPAGSKSGKRRARRAEELAAKSRQLREAVRLARERADEQGEEEPEVSEERSPRRNVPELGPREQRAMQLAYEALYDPDHLWDTVNRGDAGQASREFSRRYAELYSAGSLSDGQGQVPVSDNMRTALRDLRVLSGYAANVLHAQRADGDQAKMAEMLERLNENWRPRFDQLNADYPFLEAKMVEP
ncbi:MAG: hypothetical protein JRI55_10230 [Deltaproteobacteria bacterium]|nr:hypothetical protein [Deltaproteobacteria bacterium]